jgi:ADP-heptose:LPS heptosyltransferase
MRERLLILQLKRIGDGILTAPAVAALRARKPEAEIVAIAPEGFADLVDCFAGLDRVLPYRNASLNAKVWAALIAGGWDECYDFTGNDRSALMTRLSRAKRRFGYAKFARGWRKHAYTDLCDASVRDLHTVDFHLALIEQGAKSWEQRARNQTSSQLLNIPDSALSAVAPKLSSPFCIVHIGTAREEKFWPAERWAEAIGYLAQTHQVILTGTNTGIERPHLDQLRAQLRVPVTDLTGQLSLVQLAALIGRCDLALGVDSMAMHLAAVFAKPLIVLFGPTNPYHWRPRHDKALVLVAGQDQPATLFEPRAKGAPMELISTQRVVEAIHRALISH